MDPTDLNEAVQDNKEGRKLMLFHQRSYAHPNKDCVSGQQCACDDTDPGERKMDPACLMA